MAVVGFIGLGTAGGLQPGLMPGNLNLAVATARDACALVPFGALAQNLDTLPNRRGTDAGRAGLSRIQTVFTRPL